MYFNWLHLTDLHCGMAEQGWLWPNVREQLFADLKHLLPQAGPWDLILFTGDLTDRGTRAQFDELDTRLGELVDWIAERQDRRRPILLAVPGNHDLQRDKAKAIAKGEGLALLKDWSGSPNIQQTFWDNGKSLSRKTVNAAFREYEDWWKRTIYSQQGSNGLTALTQGLLPGDFSATIENADGCRLGVLGLNTAFRQLTEDDYQGKLALHTRQFQATCGGDGPVWARDHNACLLLTHHPAEWLDEHSRQHLDGEIANHGRFAAHLCGHLHKPYSRELAIDGNRPHRLFQGRSLFGLENYGNQQERLHGYAAGRLAVGPDRGSLIRWPRGGKRTGAEISLDRDPDQGLPKGKEASEPYVFALASPCRPKTVEPLQRDTLTQQATGALPSDPSATPRIVSLWKNPDKRDFLCSGLLLTGKHILTVRHAFEGWPDAAPVYVRLTGKVDGDVEALVYQRHRERDAAILELVTAVGPITSPKLLTRSDRTYDGQSATLRAIDPDNYGYSTLTNYSIANFDHGTGEYVIAPENAQGHSGGVVEVDGWVIGLLSRRTRTDPLCRAVAMHLLWPWIEASIGSSQGSPEPDGSLLVGTVSPAYRALVDKVRQRIQHRLAEPALAALAAAWGRDPVADLDLSLSTVERSKRIKGILHGLHRKTKECLAEWHSLPKDRLTVLKDHCRFLLSESIKLTVDPQASESELGPVSAAALDPVHLLCKRGGTADVVYCALADLDHMLERREDGLDIAADITVHFDDLLPSGEGEAKRQELLQKLWKKTMNAPLPGRVEGEDYEQLLARITLYLERDERRYVLAAPGWRDWCAKSEYRKWADDLKLGLVLHEPGGCRCLLIEEAMVIEIVRDYLQLLETL